MTRGERGPLLVLAGSVVLLVAILAIATATRCAGRAPAVRRRRWCRRARSRSCGSRPTREDAAARRLLRLAPRIPGYLSLRDAALSAVSPAPGAFDPRRDVRPWLGDEAAVALVDVGGGRFGSLVLAQVRSRPRAEALLQRVAGAGAGVRYRGTVLRRFGANAAVFARGFLVAGPEAAVRRAVDVAQGEAPALAEAPSFEAALGDEAQPVQGYVSPRGLRGYVRAQGGVAGTVAALIDTPKLRAVGASLRADRRRLHVHARLLGAAGAEVRAAAARRRAGGRRRDAGRAEPRRRRAGRAAGGRRRRAGDGADDAPAGILARPRARPAGPAAGRVHRLARARAPPRRWSRSRPARAIRPACARCSRGSRTRSPARSRATGARRRPSSR